MLCTKRALVISGGGSKGAFAGGMIEFLTQKMNLEYDLLIGTSTGALLSTLFCTGNHELAKTAFTTTSQSDIFDVDPFVIKNTKYGISLSLNHLNLIKQFIKNRKTFGESKNLRKLIEKYIQPDIFHSKEFQQKNIFVTLTNLTTNELEYKKLQDCTYEQALDWIWISCNYAPFMSIVKRNKQYYADGGFAGYIAIDKAIEEGATCIDAIILEPHKQLVYHANFNNPFSSMIRINDFMINRIKNLEIELAILKAQYKGIDLKIYYLPYVLTDNSLIFIPEEMQKWWKEGFDFMSDSIFK